MYGRSISALWPALPSSVNRAWLMAMTLFDCVSATPANGQLMTDSKANGSNQALNRLGQVCADLPKIVMVIGRGIGDRRIRDLAAVA